MTITSLRTCVIDVRNWRERVRRCSCEALGDADLADLDDGFETQTDSMSASCGYYTKRCHFIAASLRR